LFPVYAKRISQLMQESSDGGSRDVEAVAGEQCGNLFRGPATPKQAGYGIARRVVQK
jgi:hypothetical protein